MTEWTPSDALVEKTAKTLEDPALQVPLRGSPEWHRNRHRTLKTLKASPIGDLVEALEEAKELEDLGADEACAFEWGSPRGETRKEIRRIQDKIDAALSAVKGDGE